MTARDGGTSDGVAGDLSQSISDVLRRPVANKTREKKVVLR